MPWRHFWFSPADPTPLAVMRILVGGMLFYTHLVWGLNLEGFFGPNGWQGEALVKAFQQGQPAWSFWWWVPDGLHLTVHIVCLGVLALFTLGVLTPVTSVLAYLITVSYSYRAPLANYGLDQMNAIAALYLAIGPSGAVYSADSLWRRFRSARESRRSGTTASVSPARPSARANLALRLVQVHLCVIYIFACQSKLQGESWWNGQAIWQAVSNLEYQSVDLTWLAWYPWLVNLLTHATIIWEMTFWALVWRPLCRPFVLMIGVAIHLGIGAFMGMWTFGLSVIFLYVAFVPASTIHAILGFVSRRFKKRAGTSEIRADDSASPQRRTPNVATSFERTAATALGKEEQTVQLAIPAQSAAVRSAADRTAETRKPSSPEKRLTAARSSSISPGSPGFGRLPTLVLVESRLKRQTQIQEYMVRRGLRCFVASDLHQARSLLCVVDVDALVVTSTWFTDEDVRAFRDALISGGPSLPASLFFMTGVNCSITENWPNNVRHRLIHNPLSLRELRLLILEIVGFAEEPPNSAGRRSPSSPNGNGHQQDPANSSLVADQKLAKEDNSEASPLENGAKK